MSWINPSRDLLMEKVIGHEFLELDKICNYIKNQGTLMIMDLMKMVHFRLRITACHTTSFGLSS